MCAPRCTSTSSRGCAGPARSTSLLGRTDPHLVGLALDTGELAAAGLDPVDVIERHTDRLRHIQLKDALAVDAADEYLQPHAHWTVRVRGGAREVPRWFAEPGADGGLVDFASVTRALDRAATPAGSSSRATRVLTPPPVP